MNVLLRIALAVLAAIGALALVALAIVAIGRAGEDARVIRESVSPDGSRTAVLRSRLDSGPFVGVPLRDLEVRDRDGMRRLRVEVSADCAEDLSMSWEAGNRLVVTGRPARGAQACAADVSSADLSWRG